ncbi:MAG TPA: hypothetical protein VFH51_19050, partial [Myxococcota bacterium]|nr:hypothetical protein [Myxococcota bacterium]
MVDDGSLAEGGALAAEAQAAWTALAALYGRVTGAPPPPLTRPIVLGRAVALPAGHAAASQMGRILVRATGGGAATEAARQAVRHEVAHQFLWHVCPAASTDQLLHEAFAMTTSGEVAAWRDDAGPYVGVPAAVLAFRRARSVDSREARRALARLLQEEGGPLPAAVERRVRLCRLDATPSAPLGVEELAGGAGGADALVVLSRHSGAVLLRRGAVEQAMPFGSVLKPFVVAGAQGPPPRLVPEAARPEWQCGAPGGPMGAGEALARSCNGYFLDWGRRAPGLAGLGDFGPLLARLGLGRAPADVPEAIGLRASLRLSPVAVAQAYRVLAEARPDLVEALRGTPRLGTLAGLDASPDLAAWGLKTGTVRDGHSRPGVGWAVAVGPDVVVVMTRAGQSPRQFAASLTRA